jgi:predicted enzyme related to lactoylglutathione lyase
MSRPVHFEILANDPEKIAAFYRDVLGWQVATWGGPQNYWLVTTGPEGTLGINGGIMHRHFPQAVINTVGVASLEAAIAKVEAAGGKKVQGPNEIPGIGLHAYCTDPEGNYFGLLQPVGR